MNDKKNKEKEKYFNYEEGKKIEENKDNIKEFKFNLGNAFEGKLSDNKVNKEIQNLPNPFLNVEKKGEKKEEKVENINTEQIILHKEIFSSLLYAGFSPIMKHLRI